MIQLKLYHTAGRAQHRETKLQRRGIFVMTTASLKLRFGFAYNAMSFA
jgi:hypothetical protein